MRQTAFVCVYGLITQGDNVLLSLRENTGYMDGYWSLPAGHVDLHEPPTHGLVRELKEEIGITALPQDLTLAHTLHRYSDRYNIDLFFRCHQWQGEIRNCEPQKCGGLQFMNPSQLPHQTIDYIQHVFQAIQRGKIYSEYGEIQ